MDQSSSWRSPNSSRWHTPRFSPHQHQQQQNFRSTYSPNFRSPRYKGGWFGGGFHSPHSSPIMSQEQYRPYQQSHFRPRGPNNQVIRPSQNNNNIENWLSPEMWEDPWIHLIPKSSNRAAHNITHDNISNSEMKISTETKVEEAATSTANLHNNMIDNSNINSVESYTDPVPNL